MSLKLSLCPANFNASNVGPATVGSGVHISSVGISLN